MVAGTPVLPYLCGISSFMFPVFLSKGVGKTTIYWGMLRPFKGYENVPIPEPPISPKLLHEWFA
jgi:hypothetical protein